MTGCAAGPPPVDFDGDLFEVAGVLRGVRDPLVPTVPGGDYGGVCAVGPRPDAADLLPPVQEGEVLGGVGRHVAVP